MQYISPKIFPRLFRKRPASSHKGSFGTLCILGGNTGMVGAPLLAARAALKSGTGKVLVGFTQNPCPINFDFLQPELMVAHAKHWLLSDLSIKTWVVGCGLGQDYLAQTLLKYLMEHRLGKSSLVLDADALNLIAQGRVSLDPSRNDCNSIVLTPHVAEAARLLNVSIEEIEANREKSALALCKNYKTWIILKGERTLVCRPDEFIYCNNTGNVGLATAGSGDVLSGIIGSLLAQNLGLNEAVPGAVWLHGTAADRLSEENIGPIGLTAGELADSIRKIRNTWKD